jgi:hypothetical protein
MPARLAMTPYHWRDAGSRRSPRDPGLVAAHSDSVGRPTRRRTPSTGTTSRSSGTTRLRTSRRALRAAASFARQVPDRSMTSRALLRTFVRTICICPKSDNGRGRTSPRWPSRRECGSWRLRHLSERHDQRRWPYTDSRRSHRHGSRRGQERLASLLPRRGPSNVHVHLGVQDGEPVYTGITNDLARRRPGR